MAFEASSAFESEAKYCLWSRNVEPCDFIFFTCFPWRVSASLCRRKSALYFLRVESRRLRCSSYAVTAALYSSYFATGTSAGGLNMTENSALES